MALERLERQLDYLIEYDRQNPLESLPDEDMAKLLGKMGLRNRNIPGVRKKLITLVNSFARYNKSGGAMSG